MIAERAGQPLSLLILDEIFGSLDEDRRSAVVDLLRSLADRFPQVILITHIDSVREGFDRVIRVGLDVSRGVANRPRRAGREGHGCGGLIGACGALTGPPYRDIDPLNRVFAEASPTAIAGTVSSGSACRS
jgi:energy-coupling factor transporter ATP-binding protein EcfA2